jgi:DNA repair protein RecO (recombination protein O)
MSLVTTPAVVLRTYRYSETSKIVRLATRELGVQSAIAKGVLRPKSRFGAGLELLSEGAAQLYYRDNRELQTLAAFDVESLRRELAGDLDRFSAAMALAELMVRLAPPAPLPAAFDAFTGALDALVGVGGETLHAAGVRAVWSLLAVLGFEPALARCVRDETAVGENGTPIAFSTAEGGVVCEACLRSRPVPVTRLPPGAWRDLRAMLDQAAALPQLDLPHAAAHRRLAARFARHHLEDTAPGSLPALTFWERRAWPPPPSVAS